ncbi:MAG: Lrp/AsnC family transcriptional regulator [Carbonactinosporaceae bacterium]
MDGVDRKLVEALRDNARASYAELGRRVGLSGPSVAERISRLEGAGVITGYHAAVPPAALGLHVSALVGIEVSDSADHDDVAARLRGIEEIEDCWYVAGEEDFVIKVRVADVAALARTVRRLAGLRGVARVRSSVVLSTRWEGRPVRLAPDGPRAGG